MRVLARTLSGNISEPSAEGSLLCCASFKAHNSRPDSRRETKRVEPLKVRALDFISTEFPKTVTLVR